MVLASCHPLIIVFDCENYFHPPRAFHELFPFLSSEGHHVIILHSQRVAIVLQIFRCIVQYPLISSRSLRSHVSKPPQVSSFIFQFFLVNCAFATFIFNSYGGSFKISLPSLSYQFIHFFPKILSVVPSIPSQDCAISLLILCTRISSMPNPLLVINLI